RRGARLPRLVDRPWHREEHAVPDETGASRRAPGAAGIALRISMSFISKKHLPRRTFLRGMGVTMALPLLESMIPARTLLAQTAAKAAPRLAFVYVPHGAVMDQWTPATEGAGFEFTPILKPLEPYRDRLNV